MTPFPHKTEERHFVRGHFFTHPTQPEEWSKSHEGSACRIEGGVFLGTQFCPKGLGELVSARLKYNG